MIPLDLVVGPKPDRVVAEQLARTNEQLARMREEFARMNERLPPPASASPVEPINTKTWIFEQMKKGGLPSARTDLARALHKRMQTEVKVGTLTKGVSFRHLVNLLSALGLGVVRPRR